ncbi:hypothetical protein ACJX0J_033616, partial [Zea mays]
MNIIFYLIIFKGRWIAMETYVVTKEGLGVNLARSVDTVMQATQAEQKEEEGYNGKSTTIARLNEEEQLEMAMRESLRDYPIVWLEIMARQVAVGLLYQNGSMAAMKLAQQLGEVVVDDVGAKFWTVQSVYIGFGGMIWNWLTFINIVLLSFVGAALDPQELYSCQLAKGLFGDPEANLQMGIEEVAEFKRDLYMGKKAFTFVINIMQNLAKFFLKKFEFGQIFPIFPIYR